jgi:predicted DNA-binding transcriptional regulator YafY
MAHIVIRASDWLPDYLRTLPLHHSQREISSNNDSVDFSLDIRPTPDFIGELISYGESLKVLEPEDLRLKISRILKDSLKNY